VHSNRHSAEAGSLHQKRAIRRHNTFSFEGAIGEPLNDFELRGAA
jgi:hypothetical protein